MATFFENKGVQLQQDARSPYEARKRFEYSCGLCAARGNARNCASCPIADAHAITMDVFRFIANEDRNRNAIQPAKVHNCDAKVVVLVL